MPAIRPTPEGGRYAWQQVARSGSGRRLDLDRGGDRRVVGQAGDLGGHGEVRGHLVGNPKPKWCAAKHEKVKLRFVGTQQSTDARLAGRLEITAVSVVNTDPKTTGSYGYAKGTVVLRKTYSPGTTFKGEFVAVLEPDGGGEGFITGETRGKDAVHLLANFNFDMDSPGHISGEFGQDTQVQKPYAPTEDQDPAIVTNACFDRGHGHGFFTATEAATANPPDPRRRRVAGVSLAMTRPPGR